MGGLCEKNSMVSVEGNRTTEREMALEGHKKGAPYQKDRGSSVASGAPIKRDYVNQ